MTDSLAVSPDIEAFDCYAVVFLAGLIVAYVKLRKFFAGKPGAWEVPSSWGLFFAYALVPVALFWFLDRAGAIHDSSLFAAILVGFGYQQVLTGGSSPVRGPADIGKWWQPFEKWANWTSDRVLDRVKVRSDRFAAAVIRQMSDDAHADKLDVLKRLAYNQVVEPEKLKAACDAIDTPENRALLGLHGVRERQVRLLYRTIRDVSDGDYLLYKEGLISRFQYFWYSRHGAGVAAAAMLGLLVLTPLLSLAPKLFDSSHVSHYYLWRISKSNSTESDRNRAKAHLIACLLDSPAPGLNQLTSALQNSALPVDTADRLLAVIIQGRSALNPESLRRQLGASLRTEDPDVRARVHDALLYLAREARLCAPLPVLAQWKPSKSDSNTLIEERVNDWNRQWAVAPSGTPCE